MHCASFCYNKRKEQNSLYIIGKIFLIYFNSIQVKVNCALVSAVPFQIYIATVGPAHKNVENVYQKKILNLLLIKYVKCVKIDQNLK